MAKNANATKPSDTVVKDAAGNVLQVVPSDGEVKEKVKCIPVIVGNVITWPIPKYTGPALSLDRTKLNAAIRDQAELHGLAAKGTDSMAGKKGMTPEQKAAQLSRCIASLMAGNWNAGRSESIGDGVLMEAVNELFANGKTKLNFPDHIQYREWVIAGAEKTSVEPTEFVRQMEFNSKIKPTVDRIREARLSSVKLDTTEILGL
ncbi:MAG TPA: hypothetical protein VNS88_07795 [Nitrospiraceae bacterium]|nr:hypothetical protein [Nitrospiraceae bacterium]